MGRRKGSKNKKRKGSEKVRETNSTFLSEFVGGLVFVLGLALIVVFRFDNIGVAADVINAFFTGIFGVARYAISVICMYVGIVSILSSKKQKIGTELLKGLLITLLISMELGSRTSPLELVLYSNNSISLI